MLNAVLSLVFLVVAIAVGCILKKNTSVISIALSLVLARIVGIPDKTVIGYFNNSLFIMLLGIMFLFCIAQNNRTLEILARKAILLCKGKVKLIPIVLFVLGAVISVIGPGLISTTALMSVLAMALAVELSGASSVAMVTGVCIGANAAAFSPLSSCGGLMFAAYSGSTIATSEGRNKMFSRLFFFSCACILVSAVFALIGCFNWI